MKMRRSIVCSALRNAKGEIICGVRHFDKLMHEQKDARGGKAAWVGAEQGFVDNHGVFVDRKKARKIAMAAGQIVRRCGGDE